MSRSASKRLLRASLLLQIILFASQNSNSQEASLRGTGISVAVTQQAKIVPTKLRLLLPIRVETRDAAGVLKTLKSHQESVRKELKTFGLADAAIEFSSPVVTAGIPGVEDPDASRKAVRNQVIQMRNMNPHMKAQYPVPSLDDEDDSELPIVYAADATLSVEWLFENQGDDATLLPSKIKRMYEQKDLTGKKFRVELTEVEQSLVEPLLGSSNYIAYQVPTDNQRLFYVGEMTAEQEKTAYTEAVNKAKGQGELIAQSSGLRLGKIRSVQTSVGSEAATSQANVWMATRPGTTAFGREKNDREVMSSDLNGLKRSINLMVVFDFE